MLNDRITSTLARGFAVWLVIIFVESVHGVLRRLLLEPMIGDLRARQVSVFTGAALIMLLTFVFVRWLKVSRVGDFISVGILWVALTVGFEIVLGRLVMGLSWERIASDYNLMNGGLMPLGLLVMLFAPLMMAKVADEI